MLCFQSQIYRDNLIVLIQYSFPKPHQPICHYSEFWWVDAPLLLHIAPLLSGWVLQLWELSLEGINPDPPLQYISAFPTSLALLPTMLGFVDQLPISAVLGSAPIPYHAYSAPTFGIPDQGTIGQPVYLSRLPGSPYYFSIFPAIYPTSCQPSTITCTGGEGAWKPTKTSWVHCRLWLKVPTTYPLITDWVHSKCSQIICSTWNLWEHLCDIWNVTSTCTPHLIAYNS